MLLNTEVGFLPTFLLNKGTMKKKHTHKEENKIIVNKNKILENLFPIVEKSAKELNLIVLETSFIREHNQHTLRVFIYNQEKPVDHDDCANLTRLLGDQIEESNIIEVPYSIEISSPGVTRKLKNPIEYKVFKGKEVKIVLKRPLSEEDKNTVLTGILIGLTEDQKKVLVEIENTETAIKQDIIKTIQLEYKEKQSD